MFVADIPGGIWRGTLSPGATPDAFSVSYARESFAGCDTGLDTCTKQPSQWAGCTTPFTGSSCPQFPPAFIIRPMAMANCSVGGKQVLFASLGYQIWWRQDGPAPTWRLGWHVPAANITTGHNSQSGLRGLTCIANPNGSGQVLLTTMEGQQDIVWRIDPTPLGSEAWSAANEIELNAATSAAWNTTANGYQITSYNQGMPTIGGQLIIGQGSTFYHAGALLPAGHTGWTLADANRIDTGAYFWTRSLDPSPIYQLVTLPEMLSSFWMVATRECINTPFPTETGAFYCGGFDANYTPVHNTAWIGRYGD
jgi:hypothetical protein